MKYILTPDEMRLADSTAINEYSIPGIVLMENAARSASDYIFEIFENEGLNDPEILILCGSGNNGGDGFALARHLHEDYDVSIAWIGSEEKMSDETKANFQSAKKLNIPVEKFESSDDVEGYFDSFDCIIDSMIGVGGSENLRGLVVDILAEIKETDALKIAIDAPTGLNTETGMAYPDCFFADHTITMFAIKTGMLLNDGIDVCGMIHIAYLGAPDGISAGIAKSKAIERSDLKFLLPRREIVSSKFDYGKVMIIAGSRRFPGAAALTANAAVRSGAGLVYLFTTSIHHSLAPEVIPTEVDSTPDGGISFTAYDTIMETAMKSDVVAIGPGIGREEETLDMVRKIVFNLPDHISIILDADAIGAINPEDQLRNNIIITPHCGEFAALTGEKRSFVEQNHAWLAKEWAAKLNCTALLKHVPSVISNGRSSYWNLNGNPGMATGGSGDVLTGVIAGLLAQETEPLKAAAFGAFIHADAGDRFAEEYSMESLTASDIIDYLKVTFLQAE